MFFLKYVAYALCFLLFSFMISVLAGMFLRRMTSVNENFEREVFGTLQPKTKQAKTPRTRARKAASGFE
jgi:hypothetical protein